MCATKCGNNQYSVFRDICLELDDKLPGNMEQSIDSPKISQLDFFRWTRKRRLII
jgi:hypothetical protein